MQVDWGSRTDTGRVRANNEDALIVREDLSLAILCDGMGGHRAGEVASRIAVEAFATRFEAGSRRRGRPVVELGGFASEATLPAGEMTPGPGVQTELPVGPSPCPASFEGDILFEAAGRANLAVFTEAQSSSEYLGMGCTLVALHLGGGFASFVTVGDSRLYLLRAGQLLQVSEDHTRLRALERMGIKPEPIELRRIRGVLTRAVGTHPDIEVDCGGGPTMEGDAWMLCSDGLTDELSDEEIRSILLGPGDSRSMARTCVQRAVAAGGRDNVSVVVARVVNGPPANGRAELPTIETRRIVVSES